MKDIKWIDGNRIQVDPPKKVKKCTGTRFASIMGLNVWSTPFQMWSQITKTYEPPFEDTIYTVAGKIIEPKQASYMEESYGMEIVRPTDIYGEDPFKATWGDFFPDQKVFGGSWDYLLKDDETGEIKAVLEMKTTKRAEDWREDVPEYYALQAALYAYLLGVDDVIMVASFLDTEDYAKPQAYVPSASNTITVPFKVSERYPDFKEKIAYVKQWWKDHIETGISPEYDEKADAEYLEALRTNSLAPDTDIQGIIAEAESLKSLIDDAMIDIKGMEIKLKKRMEVIKAYALEQFREEDKKVTVTGKRYNWTVSKSQTETVNKEKMKEDGIYDQYKEVSDSYRMSVKEIK